ncbi:Uncharacterised protein [Mycobacteroides abscessus subsp. massiliense]|nr:Uncharacterised protein [Mycobacteroides abscessus subsp. massiliense]
MKHNRSTTTKAASQGGRTCPTPWKRRFRDDIAAKLDITRLARNAHQRCREAVRPYPCRCGGWHLTGNPKRKPAA